MIANEKMRSTFEQTIDKRAELEIRYGQKATNTPNLAMAPVTVTMTPSNSSTSQTPRVPAGAIPTPQRNGIMTPTTPVTPITPGVESAVSSDAEGPQSPDTLRSKSAKKSKKRK
jgi:translocation protein SEC66